MVEYKPEHAAPEQTEAPRQILNNTMYDLLKKFITMVLPAFGTFYVTMAQLWSLPNAEGVAATCLAVGTFLGVLLNLSGHRYETSGAKYDGVINVVEDEDGVLQAGIDLKNYVDPAAIVQQDTAVFKIKNHT